MKTEGKEAGKKGGTYTLLYYGTTRTGAAGLCTYLVHTYVVQYIGHTSLLLGCPQIILQSIEMGNRVVIMTIYGLICDCE